MGVEDYLAVVVGSTFWPMVSDFSRKFLTSSSSVTVPLSKMVRELIPDSRMFFAISEPSPLMPIRRTFAALSLEGKHNLAFFPG